MKPSKHKNKIPELHKPTSELRVTKHADLKGEFFSGFNEAADPIEWIEKNLGVSLFSNQLESIGHLFDRDVTAFNVLACRGAGKSQSLVYGLLAYGILYPGLRVIVTAPKEKQAGRLLKEMYNVLKSKKCLISDEIDRSASSAHRIQFKNGSYIVALSGQETANVEGEHGHILVVDEAHKTPTYSVTNKLTPMIGMLEFSKTIKIGVSMGRNHFWKSCTAPGAIVDACPWYKAEIFQKQDKQVMYRGKPYPLSLIQRMPRPYKLKYFPDRPDLHKETGQEIPVLDWETQYELMWADDINNFLTDEDQELLAAGKHKPLTRGFRGEFYCAGLDTAQGSLTGRKGTDETVLSIWRMTADGMKEKVASYIWLGQPLVQIDEIWEIVNPETGLFPCKFTFVDYSNIGINIVEMFRARGVKIAGIHFQATEPKSKKNWKNAMYDYFQIQLQLGKVVYPSIKGMENDKVHAQGEYRVQIENMLQGFNQWCQLIRIRGKGLNDRIEAPTENVENEDGQSEKSHDDIPSSDILGCWSLTHVDELTEMSVKAGDLSGYQIPLGVIGVSTDMMRMSGQNKTHILDAIQKAPQTQAQGPKQPDTKGTDYLASILGPGKSGR